MNEIKTHRGLLFINVCKLNHFFDDDDNIYILLELCINGNLEELIRKRKRLHTLEVQYITH